MVECCVCQEVTNCQKFLSCGNPNDRHKLCLICIQKLQNDKIIECPICRVKTILPFGDPSKLQTKFFADLTCEDCSSIKNVEENWWCKTCEVTICGNCAMKRHRNHKCSPWENYDVPAECFTFIKNELQEKQTYGNVEEKIKSYCQQLEGELIKKFNKNQNYFDIVNQTEVCFGTLNIPSKKVLNINNLEKKLKLIANLLKFNPSWSRINVESLIEVTKSDDSVLQFPPMSQVLQLFEKNKLETLLIDLVEINENTKDHKEKVVTEKVNKKTRSKLLSSGKQKVPQKSCTSKQISKEILFEDTVDQLPSLFDPFETILPNKPTFVSSPAPQETSSSSKQTVKENAAITLNNMLAEQKTKFIEMSLDEKRSLYHCGKLFVTLDRIPNWPSYAKSKKLECGGITYNIQPNSAINNKIGIYIGNIARLEVDVIVNSTNNSLSGNTGLDAEIRKAAGNELSFECMNLVKCYTGDAKITLGYRLPAKRVIHTVGPGSGDDPNLLKSCYLRSLDLAVENHLTSIAFPCIPNSVHGYSNTSLAPVVLKTIREWLEIENNAHSIERIIFSLYRSDEIVVYESLLQQFFPYV